jgi:hypothetical protein
VSAVPIEPDTKDWTWVLQRPCPQCGLDAAAVRPEDVAGMLRVTAARWTDELTQRSDVRQRPRYGVWSPLEYGCHVRDVFRRFDQRLQLMLAEDDPLFENGDQDATALNDRYGEQDPAVVAGELRAAARVLADRFAAVRSDQWQRSGRRCDGAAFTVESFARYLIHDPVHHLHDVTGRRAG